MFLIGAVARLAARRGQQPPYLLLRHIRADKVLEMG